MNPKPEERVSIQVGDRTRTFTVVGEESSTLVLVLHGSKQSGAKHRDFTGRQFDQLADGRARVVYLDGYRNNWNDARRDIAFAARKENVDDVAFARAVAGELGARKVFAVGFSNGGAMVMRLIHEVPDLLSGAMIIGASMPAPESFLLPHEQTTPNPIPVVLVHGTEDPLISYRGGGASWLVRTVFKVGGHSLSVPGTARYFATRNGITQPPTSTVLPARTTTTSVERTDFRQEGRPGVTLFTVHGGGHTVPGPKKAPRVLGRTHPDLSAADLAGELLLGDQ